MNADGRSVRDQHLPLPDLLLVYSRMNMMRLWVSLMWNPGKQKGLRREMIQTFRMLKKLPPEEPILVKKANSETLGPGEMEESLTPGHSNRVLLPLLPSTLGKV